MKNNVLVLLIVTIFFGCNDAPKEDTDEPKENANTASSETSVVVSERPHLRGDSEHSQTALKDGNHFRAEIIDVTLFDSALHSYNGAGSIDTSRAGPRMLVVGRVYNGTQEHIVSGGVYASLEICTTDSQCSEKGSHDRGFILPLTGSTPWRPKSWRQFVVATRPNKPVLRELNPSSVKGALELEAEGAISLRYHKEIWKNHLDWERLGGKVVNAYVPVNKERRVLRQKLVFGESIRIEAVSGAHVAVQAHGKRGWVPLHEIPEGYAVVREPVPPNPIPFEYADSNLSLKIAKMYALSIQDETTDRISRYVLFDLVITARNESGVRLRNKDFDLLVGNQTLQTPQTKMRVLPRPMSFEKILLGETRKGTIAFECPFGSNPLRLRLALKDNAYLEIILPHLINSEND